MSKLRQPALSDGKESIKLLNLSTIRVQPPCRGNACQLLLSAIMFYWWFVTMDESGNIDPWLLTQLCLEWYRVCITTDAPLRGSSMQQGIPSPISTEVHAIRFLRTCSRIIHHVTKLISSQTCFLNITMIHCPPIGFHSHQIPLDTSPTEHLRDVIELVICIMVVKLTNL